MLIGAHVSTAGGVSKAVARGQDIGAECIQVFASSPRMWAAKKPPAKEITAFREAAAAAELGPTVIHGKYLLGLGSPVPELVDKSVTALISDVQTAHLLGALGVIFHPASHKGRGFEDSLIPFTDALKRVLDETPEDVLIMLETSAGAGDHIGSKFAELGRIIEVVNHERVTVCLDTQHVWASGYDISKPDTLDAVISEFNAKIGLQRLRAVHANDSKRPLGSAVDRHENIGYGEIGEAGFKCLLTHEAFRDVPFYLEVPGMEKQGPDKPNVDALKRIRDSLA